MSEFLPNMSGKKAENLIEKYFDANITEEHKRSDEVKRTMAGLTADEVNEITFANKLDYVRQVAEKTKEGIGPEICLKEGQTGFNIVFYNDTNYYDLARPQSQIDILDKREKIRKQLKKVNNQEKVVVVFGGNLLGEEWKLANLRNALILDTKEYTDLIHAILDSEIDETSKNKIAHSLETLEDPTDEETTKKVERIVGYWGIKKRTSQLRNDIRTYLSVARELEIKDFEIILMNGAQEHKVKQKFNLDVLDKVYNELKEKCSNITYVDQGVNVIFPVFTDHKSESSHHISLNIQTNSRTKATKASSVLAASNRENGPTNACACFRLNVANFSGCYQGVFYPTGQSMFNKASKGDNPERAPQDRDVYHIDITGNDKCEVTRGGSINLNEYALERVIKEEQLKRDCIKEIIMEIYETKVNNIIMGEEGDENGKK